MKITNCAYAACGALRKSASAGRQAGRLRLRLALCNSDRCCIVIACGCIIAALHFALGCTAGGAEGEKEAEAATMISTTSKPIRSCNIFTEAERETDCDASLRSFSFFPCSPYCPVSLPLLLPSFLSRVILALKSTH